MRGHSDAHWDHEPVRLLSRPSGTLSSTPSAGEGRGEEALRFMESARCMVRSCNPSLEPFEPKEIRVIDPVGARAGYIHAALRAEIALQSHSVFGNLPAW